MDIRASINAIMAEKGIKVRDDASTMRQLGLDSLDAMALVMQLEKQTGVTIDSATLTKIETIGDLIKAFKERLGEK